MYRFCGFSLLLCLLVGLLGGCASRGGSGMSVANADAKSEVWRLTQLEAAFQDFQEEARGREAKGQADRDALSDTLMNVQGELIAAKQERARISGELSALKAELEMLHHLARGTAATSSAPSSASKASMKAVADTAAKRAAAAPAPRKKAPVQVGETTGAEAAAYSKALTLTRSGKQEAGREAFQSFLETYPTSPLAPNALYWLGETYYAEQRFAQSILAFKEVTTRFPDHDKAPAALLKSGYAYEKLGDLENARFHLRTLLDSYPDSDPASLAKSKLAAF